MQTTVLQFKIKTWGIMRILSTVNKYTLCLVLVVSMVSSFAYAANPPTAYDIMKPPTYSSVELSPSGRYVAFVQVKTDKYCIDRYGSMVQANKSKCEDEKKSYRSTHIISVYDLNVSKIIKDMPPTRKPLYFMVGMGQ